MKVKNMLNATPSSGERMVGKSLTVPDQSMTLRTILDRHKKGLPITGVFREPTYAEEGDDYIPDPRRLDLAEREELAAQFAAEMKEIQGRRKKAEQEYNEERRKQQEEEAAVRAEYRRRQQEGAKGDSTNNP